MVVVVGASWATNTTSIWSDSGYPPWYCDGSPHQIWSTSGSTAVGAVQSYDHAAAVTPVAIGVTVEPICQISTGPSGAPSTTGHSPEIRAVPPTPTVIEAGATLSGIGGAGALVVVVLLEVVLRRVGQQLVGVHDLGVCRAGDDGWRARGRSRRRRPRASVRRR